MTESLTDSFETGNLSNKADVHDDSDSEDDLGYPHTWKVESIRTTTGLEVGLRVLWPNQQENYMLNLSTCLPSTEIAPMFHGTQWAGTRVWQAAMIMLEYLLTSSQQLTEATSTTTIHNTGSNNVPNSLSNSQQENSFCIDENTTVLELGCGLGVPGMLLHAVKKCKVVLTDKGSLLEQLQSNLQANAHVLQVCNKNDINNDHNNSTICAQSLDWSVQGVHQLLQNIHEMNFFTTNYKNTVANNASHANVDDNKADKSSSELKNNDEDGNCNVNNMSKRSLDNDNTNNTNNDSSKGFDIVLNCDCIYEPLYGTSWKSLWECQQELLRINPQTVMLTSVERRKSDGVDFYLEEMMASPLVSRVEKIQPPFATPVEVEIYRTFGYCDC